MTTPDEYHDEPFVIDVEVRAASPVDADGTTDLVFSVTVHTNSLDDAIGQAVAAVQGAGHTPIGVAPGNWVGVPPPEVVGTDAAIRELRSCWPWLEPLPDVTIHALSIDLRETRTRDQWHEVLGQYRAWADARPTALPPLLALFDGTSQPSMSDVAAVWPQARALPTSMGEEMLAEVTYAAELDPAEAEDAIRGWWIVIHLSGH